ncbi:MAG: type II toxin-antitoxin system HicA family toxin [Candidatus Eremiobacteraeota bacterium]|nr:type II toxin-antitoxin system HicA family toxin [Candidatus Eremiobacteraeota bacterium]MBC5821241.1 type II toxin-antitoxin system HicA family toxin [Candidatus Eremiobacteraeota bacterium]
MRFRPATPVRPGLKLSQYRFRRPKCLQPEGRALQRAGFAVTRIVGSHHFVRHPDGRATSVPVHGARDVPAGTLARILKDVRLTRQELQKLL